MSRPPSVTLRKLPRLDTEEDAVMCVKRLAQEGIEVFWHNESKRLVTRPRVAGEQTMERVTGLLNVRSPKDWESFKKREGLD